MKKKITIGAIALAVAAALALGIRSWFPATPNKGFGLLRDAYTPDGYEIPITDCEGDTDILRAEAVVESERRSQSVCVRFTAFRKVAFTTAEFYQGKTTSDTNPSMCGFVERLEEVGWVELSKLYNRNSLMEMRSISEGEGENAFTFPSCEPGIYRITYLFREVLGDTKASTSEELYSISHTYVVEGSKEDFDLLSVKLSSSGVSDPNLFVWVSIRSNCGKSICQDRYNGKLEKQVDGEWIAVGAKGGGPGVDIQPYSRTGGYQSAEFNGTYAFTRGIFAKGPGVYRLTLYLVENRDGSGARHTLQLVLDLSE